MTNEPPKGLKSNIKVSFTNELLSDHAFFDGNSKGPIFKKLLYGLCFFHAIVQERRTYGPLGWNILYEFTQNDLKISAKQIFNFTAEYETVPFKALKYLIGECNYGGRITDDRDRIVVQALLDSIFNEKLFASEFMFGDLKEYVFPQSDTYEKYINHIDHLPLFQNPALYGFHSNAQIVKDLNESNQLYSSLLLITGGINLQSNDETTENVLRQISNSIVDSFPKKFDLEFVNVKYQISLKNSMNSVLQQELLRFNILSKVILDSLKEIDSALKGDIGMSESLENICNSLIKGVVPKEWKRVSYPSLKHLAGYIEDLKARMKHFHKWVDIGPPSVFWISGFFFTQSFLTGLLQNYARKHTIPIDMIDFDFEFLGEPGNPEEHKKKYRDPEEGGYIYGLFLEGANWDYNKKKLIESYRKILWVESPIIWLKPEQTNKIKEKKYYKCPVYRTIERKGTLSTTGHSTNFVMNVKMNTDIESDHWVKRGTALICELKD